MQRMSTFQQELSNSIKKKAQKTKWITFGIIKSINHRDKLFQTLKMTDPDSYNHLRYLQ